MEPSANLRAVYQAGTVLVLLTLFSGCGPTPPVDSVPAIQASFGAWKTAMLAHDGHAASLLVTQASLEQFGRYRELALRAPETELDQLALIDRMFVLILRVQLSAERLEAMTPAQVLDFLVETRALGMDYAGYSEIDQVEVRGERATARHTKFGRQIGAPLGFAFESQWKQDLLPVIEQMGRDMDDYLARMEQKVAPTIYADAIVETFTGKMLEPRHLKPLAVDKPDS